MSSSAATIKSNSTQEKAYSRSYALSIIRLRVPKGRKADIETHAKSKGESINGLVNALLRADMNLTEEEWKKLNPND